MPLRPEPPQGPPTPTPGSASSFALLYFPTAGRREFALLLALEAEIGAGVARRLDHALAHARLDWWREEAARHAHGAARHPWLRMPAAAPARLGLGALVQAALLDLAEAQHATPHGRRLRGALFCAAAGLLDASPPSPCAQESLATLGALCAQLEPAPGAAPAAFLPQSLARLRQAIAQVGPAQQRGWMPLLVWCAIGARHAARPESASRLAGFADNIAAWRAARAASAGGLRLREDPLRS
jgi:hypothetical protein